ncbi:hypothetical protein [Nonomuraea sp. NPDC049158]|uniref:hypothetical protein n=1 Tax=Nonomuraea sp. NPDC049158 TaxID=3155649 RepID=UPI0033FB5BC3
MSLSTHPEPALAELAEAEMMYQLESAAPAAARDAQGVECVRLAGGVVPAMRDDPTGYWSKALGFGFDEPVTEKLIGEICEFYRSRSVPAAVRHDASGPRPDVRTRQLDLAARLRAEDRDVMPRPDRSYSTSERILRSSAATLCAST